MRQKPASLLPCGHHRTLPFPDIVARVPVPGEAIDQMGSKEPLPLKASCPPLGFHIAFPGGGGGSGGERLARMLWARAAKLLTWG